MKIAVVAHRKKTIGGGLVELRRIFTSLGFPDPLWYEVDKSRKAPKAVRAAVDEGAELIFVWGGDGTVQRSLDVLAGTGIPMAIVPAGTANLFATNLGIPIDLEEAVTVGFHGVHRKLDVGRINGERFGVMAGIGADALMIKDADRGLKDRFGRSAYLLTGSRNLSQAQGKVVVEVDGKKFYKGPAGCVLVGNVGKVFGGVEAFDDATPDDGKLDVGVVTATSPMQWSRVLARATMGRTSGSKYVRMTSGRRIDVRIKPKMPYELDGGDRPKTGFLKIRVETGALVVCVPADLAS